jgi:hypothetical protein
MASRPMRIAIPSSMGAATILTAAALLFSPSLAGAQTTTEPTATQTEPVLGPPGSVQSGSRDSGNGGEGGDRAPAAAQPSASSGGGLPLTGYPWTPVVIVALVLLCSGLVLRIVLRGADRPRLRL